MKCSVCFCEDLSHLSFREMMFGFRDDFVYLRCNSCGCIQIQDVPEDLSKYYPDNYYSFVAETPDPLFVRFLKILRDRWAVFGSGLFGRMLYKIRPHTELFTLQALNPQTNAKILDIGCGSGRFLSSLRRIGFSNLLGIDPFLKEENEISIDGFSILRKSLFDLPEKNFDFIIMNHSFEHMSDPRDVFSVLKKKLSPHGKIVIRIPLSDSWAACFYGKDWVQVDAPRHLFLHTRKSIESLAQASGLCVERVSYDSNAFQFWGSEQYKAGISLTDERSYAVNPRKSIFSKSKLREFKRESQRLNDKKMGDQAIFYIKHEVLL